MYVHNKIKTAKHLRKKRGAGIINSIIDKLPIELHIPGYRYCGPGKYFQQYFEK